LEETGNTLLLSLTLDIQSYEPRQVLEVRYMKKKAIVAEYKKTLVSGVPVCARIITETRKKQLPHPSHCSCEMPEEAPR
jgi:hypothetical protein